MTFENKNGVIFVDGESVDTREAYEIFVSAAADMAVGTAMSMGAEDYDRAMEMADELLDEDWESLLSGRVKSILV